MLRNMLTSPPACRPLGGRLCLLLVWLLLAAPAAFGQAPSVIYGLLNVYRTTTAVPAGTAGNTAAIPSYPKGTQTLVGIDPATGMLFGQGNTTLPPVLVPIAGITAGQILVGIDVRPGNGALYGLGYDTLTTATQLYRLTPLIVAGTTNVVSGATAASVGPAISLPLGNISPAATSKRIGFDFNPAADLARVVSANGRNYRLNPNTGALVAADGVLAYVPNTPVSVPVPTVTGPASPAPATSAGVGAVAYTNSQLVATSTQLYAYDELDRGILSQVPDPNSGVLTNPIAASFFITGSPSGQGPYIITPKLVALDIDFYYNRAASTDVAYLLEVTADQPAGYHASNLYTLNVSNNEASRVGSILTSPNPSTITNPLIANFYSLDVIDIAAGIAAPLTWSGFVSDEWTNPLNWVPNRVPTSSDDVLIPGTYTPGATLAESTFPGSIPTPNQPVVRVAGQVARSIRMNTVATLTLVTPGSLNVATDFVNNGGTLNTTSGALVVSGSYTGTNSVYNNGGGTLTVSGSFANTTSTINSTAGTLTVGGSLTNTGGTITGSGGTITVGGSFVNANAASTLTLNSGFTFNLGGNFTNTGGTVGGSGTGRLALTGSVVQTIGGTISTFPNLTVGTASAATTGPVNIRSTGGLTLNGNLAIGSGQAFTLLSDASGTAFVVNTGSALATGTATVQRYIAPANAGLGYRHYSTPVRGNTVADFTTTGFTPVVNPGYNGSANPGAVSPFPTVFAYDQSRLSLNNSSPEFDKGFFSPSALTDPLVATVGYTVNLPGTALVDFVGTLNTGSISRIGLAHGTQTNAGWQFLGNPYPSAINYDVVRTNSTGIEAALYVYRSTGPYVGTYTSYVNGVTDNTGSNVLPVAQGFFVRVATGQTGTVNFTNAARLTVPDNTLFYRLAADLRPRLALTLRNATLANQTVVYFEQGATPDFDMNYDAHYLAATHGLDLATDIGSEALSINGQPALSGAAVVVPLYLHAATAGTYTLAADELANLPAGYHAYLRDAVAGTYTDLGTTPSLSLALSPTAAPTGRYALVVSAASPLATAPASAAQLVSLYPNPARGTASLLPQALRPGAATPVVVLDNLGRTVLTRTLAAGAEAVSLPLQGLSPGVYVVQAQTTVGLVAKKLVVE
ncbi:DUF4394 domain-containing protein [Hymenobacter cheonanensis]|uniref:DUF4394 domain-containing protein n=1 Tax=Hymenobacter sp. CA2-7 TaxID=3063993 RepID=UPI002712EBE9|nr:DUF4394 domain-containing protein [Hymenobacter sp. CA2-7]MDO7884192.1 DUF4394 domain-containing protein [Hymenobacter sp. CA2-7]